MGIGCAPRPTDEGARRCRVLDQPERLRGCSAALEERGFVALETQPPEESVEYMWHGIQCSTALFDRNPDGTFRTVGRWDDWVFPAGSFGTVLGQLQTLRVPVMSAAGMLTMKEQYASLRNGKPLREKDRRDIPILRQLVGAATGD